MGVIFNLCFEWYLKITVHNFWRKFIQDVSYAIKEKLFGLTAFKTSGCNFDPIILYHALNDIIKLLLVTCEVSFL